MAKLEPEIKLYPKLIFCPHVKLAAEGWLDLINQGYNSSQDFPVAWDHKALVAMVNNEPQGIMLYSDQEWNNMFYLVLSYVRPMFRRKGIATAMFQALVAEGKRLDKICIQSTISAKNYPSLRAVESQGREIKGYLTYYSLTKEP